MGRKDVKVKVKASPSDEEHKDEESPDYTSDDEVHSPHSTVQTHSFACD